MRFLCQTGHRGPCDSAAGATGPVDLHPPPRREEPRLHPQGQSQKDTHLKGLLLLLGGGGGDV